MSKAENYIVENMESGLITGWDDKNRPICQSWLTPDQARKAVDIAREEVIEKAIGWIEEINNHHHIMRYSDSCEPPISELTEWFKNYMTETKMEIVKLMPKEYTKAEADAFKHGFFLGAKSEREELIQEATEWIKEHKEAVETEDNGIMGWIPDYFIEDFKKAMKDE